MSNRFTDSEKWDDPWFRKLSPNAKLLYLYLCDRCDIAGFWEIDTEDAAFRTRIDEDEIKSSLESLGEKLVKNSRYLWLKNFLKRQKNLPLDPFVPSEDGKHGCGNKAHTKIVKLLAAHRGLCFEIDSLLDSVKGYLSSIDPPLVGDVSPPGIGIGNGIDNGIGSSSEKDEEFSETDSVIDYFNEKSNSSYKHKDSSRKNIHARLAEGFTVDDCKLVIDFKVDAWLGDPKMEQYLRPITLFGPEKFEGYLNAAKRWDASGRKSSAHSGNGSSPSTDRNQRLSDQEHLQELKNFRRTT